ncbi:LOW QUALITY PROTEIN: GATOR1 complex protein DEPDC5-like [Liolophura sinensis]|uniref:LOW QUALITY PROTEIN: GATOR1 complex protein DEPDC5-like n=1 Tax=Liolophura sinensis TaxID=3198878 RepID=UPI0031590F5D
MALTNQSNMKTYKLWLHQKSRTSDPNVDIVINPKEFPGLKAKDILEIYHPDEEYSRLLLQFEELNDEQKQINQKETVSIDQSIATAFQLRMYKDVYVQKVNPQDVTLDLVELLFKEQYYSRSDMWRMRKSLVNTCAYLTKKVAFADMRAQVNELWAKGEKVTCGVVSEDTRIVFRSPTAVVSIFIQMSSEMWEFDNYGDLYFEKAVDGFLKDLFAKWKEQNCLHDVTIVLFSRTFFDAKSRDEFPRSMRDCVQQDYRGRFYEDYYRVVIQNERYEDWTSTLVRLKTLFNEYPQRVLHYHENRGDNQKVPTAHNSTAAQGNFLETLNMALNLFEKWYIDRNFDRTGKVAVVITPGAGVFEVDRELCNITKQRTIDCGVGSDLVCVGEQPLHAVPLFRFHNKNPNQRMQDMGDDYNIPHWMNHSFYTSRSQVQCLANSTFVPRIKPPPEVKEALLRGKSKEQPKCKKKKEADKIFSSPPYINENEENFQFIDYDEYDAQVFKIPSRPMRRGGFHNWTTGSNLCTASTIRKQPKTLAEAKKQRQPRDRHISDNFSDRQRAMSEEKHSPTAAIGIPHRHDSRESASSSVGCYPILGKTNSKDSLVSSESEESFLCRPIVGSAGSPVGHTSRTSLINYRPNRALINPFAPSRMQFKMTSNRRRWVHAFPIDPRGASVQTHHVHMSGGTVESDELGTSPPTREAVQAAQIAVEARKVMSASQEGEITDNYTGSMSPTSQSYVSSLKGVSSGDNLVASGEMPGLSPSNSQVTFELPGVASTTSVSSLTSGFDSATKLTFPMMKGPRDNLTDISDNRAWLWGPTGEQEWSPDITTGLDWRPLEAHEMSFGDSQLVKPILTARLNTQSFCATISVDWKSIVMPASLPISTDYFPDKRSLHNDYVQNDYTLLPDDVNADYWMRPPSTDGDRFYRRQPLTTEQVFEELISQRLAQGFQLILMPKASPGSSSVSSVLSSSPQYHGSASKIRSSTTQDHSEEYYLSIGRIFHRLTLTQHRITVTRYRPRHPQPQLYYKYQYRFQAPDSFNYDVSWTKFSNEKLENYNWNYLDQYICTRGEGDYGLMESLKFWRSRFLLLPCVNPATKKIIDGHKYCDIYEEKTHHELKQLIEGFLRCLEILNNIKRTASTRRTKGQQPKTAPSTPVKGASTPQSGGTKTELFPEERSKEVREGAKGSQPSEGGTRSPAEVKKLPNPPSPLISQISTEVASVTMGYSEGQGSHRAGDSRGLSPEPVTGLSVMSPSQDIIDAMMDPNEGFQFLTNPGLPPLCFVSAEGVHWCLAHIRGVNSPSQGIQLIQKLMNEKYIGHASRNSRHRFIYGFYLYVIFQKESQDKSRSSGDLDSQFSSHFSIEWCEVAVDPVDPFPPLLGQEAINSQSLEDHRDKRKMSGSLPSSLEDWRSQSGLPAHDLTAGSVYHKFVNVDVDPMSKVNRPEWATARYHANYSPTCAFELQVQWMVATGTVLGELVYSWARKASSCGFHLLPVPVDPFDLPYTPNSDPLRGPTFVPLRMECLVKEGMEKIFEGCDDDERAERLLHFQETILKRFGFMQSGVRLPNVQTYKDFEDTQHHFTHCTGGMFVLIPDTRAIPSQDSSYNPSYAQKASLLHHDYIARQTSRTDTPSSQAEQVSTDERTQHIGFLWSWNFMSTKRWRSPNTGDEVYQDKMLEDFRNFTSNSEERLVNFWKEYREINFPHLWGQFSCAPAPVQSS